MSTHPPTGPFMAYNPTKAVILRHFQPTVLSLPIVQSGFRNPVLACQIACLSPSFVLTQNCNDLLFREPDPLHRPSSRGSRTLNPRGGKTQWQVTWGTHRA